MAIPKAPVKRIIQEAGAERVSADAVDTLVEFLEDYAEDVSKKAVVYTKYANRKTVKAEDIDLAVGSSKTSESPEHKHNILDVQKEKALKTLLNHLKKWKNKSIVLLFASFSCNFFIFLSILIAIFYL